MKSWNDLLGMVELWQVAMVDDDPPIDSVEPETYEQSVLREIERTEPAVTAACESLITTMRVPKLQPVERFFLWARLDYARELLLSLRDAPSQMPPADQTLRWLLGPAWRVGRQRFLQRVRDASCKSFPRES
jgi:hypothetical protein